MVKLLNTESESMDFLAKIIVMGWEVYSVVLKMTSKYIEKLKTCNNRYIWSLSYI